MERTGYSPSWANSDVDVRASRFITGVYVWMAMGVLTTAAVGYALYSTGTILGMLRFAGRGFMWGVLLLQMGSVMAFSGSINRMNVSLARTLFFVYSVITGATVALVSLIYTLESLAGIFALATLAFAALALFGAVTKRNLGPIGTFCGMGLFMVFGLGMFYMLAATFGWFSGWMESLNLTIGIIGIAVFSGLTAWESQKIREMAYSLAKTNATATRMQTAVTSGAFTMYLNFINLFFSLLRVFGDRR